MLLVFVGVAGFAWVAGMDDFVCVYVCVRARACVRVCVCASLTDLCNHPASDFVCVCVCVCARARVRL